MQTLSHKLQTDLLAWYDKLQEQKPKVERREIETEMTVLRKADMVNLPKVVTQNEDTNGSN